MHAAADLLEQAADRYELEHQAPGDVTPATPNSYKRRAQNALIIQMLRNGGDRSFELPQLPPRTSPSE